MIRLMNGPLMFVCAHDDDAILFASSLLASREPTSKLVVVMSTSDVLYSTKAECEEAYSSFPGVKLRFMEGHERRDMRVCADRETISYLLDVMVRESICSVISPSHLCAHRDHRASSEACEQACFHYNTWAGKGRTVAHFEGEILTPLPEVHLRLTVDPEVKRRAMACFSAQESQFPWADAVLALNRFRALQSNCDGHVEALAIRSAISLPGRMGRIGAE